MKHEKGAPQGAPFFVYALLMASLACLASCAKPGAFSVEETLRTGAGPAGMALSPDGTLLAVACQRSNDVWIDNLQDKSTSRVDTLPSPRDVAFDPDGQKVIVSESGGDSIAQISLDQMRITRRFNVLPQPVNMTSLADGSRMLVTSLSLTGAGVFHMPHLRTEKILSMDGFCQRILQSVDGKQLFAVTRDIPAFVSFRVADLSRQISILVKGLPVDLALSPHGDFAWVAGAGAATEVSPSADVAQDGAITCIRLADLVAVETVPVSGSIRAIAVSKSGRWLYLACGDAEEIQVMDSQTYTLEAHLHLEGEPSCLLLSPDGKRLFVAQSGFKSVSVIRCGPWQ